MQRGIKRSFLHLERFVGGLSNPPPDRVPVHWSQAHCLENQHVERSYKEITSSHPLPRAKPTHQAGAEPLSQQGVERWNGVLPVERCFAGGTVEGWNGGTKP